MSSSASFSNVAYMNLTLYDGLRVLTLPGVVLFMGTALLADTGVTLGGGRPAAISNRG